MMDRAIHPPKPSPTSCTTPCAARPERGQWRGLRNAVMLLGTLLGSVGLSFTAHADTVEQGVTVGVTVRLMCGAVGAEYNHCRDGARAWATQTGNSVAFVSAPSNANERLALMQQLFATGDTSIDVFQMDIVWPGILANNLLDLSPYVSPARRATHFPQIIANNTVDGKLVAAPWFIDAGILYYRRDLLEDAGMEVPTTWDGLEAAARIIQQRQREAGNERFWGYVFQGRAYEGLTCNALEWISSYGGGTIVDAHGAITINNPQAADALNMARRWIGTITPRGVMNYSEEEARGVFQSGNAAFMRNWPYAWSILNGPDSGMQGKVGITVLPRSSQGTHAATLGGSQLSVSRYSRHPDAAAALVLYLTGEAEQKRRAIQGGYAPTIRALYQDADVLSALPHLEALYPAFDAAVARPSSITGIRYNQVSSAFWNMAHAILSGSEPASYHLEQMERRLERVSRGGTWGRRNAPTVAHTPEAPAMAPEASAE